MGWFSRKVLATLIDDATGAAFAATKMPPGQFCWGTAPVGYGKCSLKVSLACRPAAGLSPSHPVGRLSAKGRPLLGKPAVGT